MFVWNAISSMTLMIFEIFADETLMASIARNISFISLSPFCACTRALPVSSFAWSAFSALLLVCEAISAMDDESSSTEDACSAAPCDS